MGVMYLMILVFLFNRKSPVSWYKFVVEFPGTSLSEGFLARNHERKNKNYGREEEEKRIRGRERRLGS